MIVNLEATIERRGSAEKAMRIYRDTYLAACDWTQLPDNGLTDEQRAAWATYRQALRDFPATWTPGPTADFPEAPA